MTVFSAAPQEGAVLSEWDRITGATDARQRAILRKLEDISAWESIGLPYNYLEFVEQPEPPSIKKIAAAMAHLGDEYRTVYVPAGIGAHPDHVAVRDAALISLANKMEFILYAELPYAAFYGWPTDIPGAPDVVKYWDGALETIRARGRSIITQIHVLDEKLQEWKCRLLSHYASQVGAVSGGSLDLFHTTELLKYEVEFHLS